MSEDIDIKEKLDPKKRGLGRGLNALFEDEESTFTHQMEESGDSAASGIKHVMIGIDQLEPGKYQPRRDFSAQSIADLAESITAHGVLQPLIVRPKRGFSGFYEIIAGERRWRAAQEAQLHEVPAIIKPLEDKQALEIALIENLQREDLNSIDEALGYRQLMEEFGHTQEQAAKALGKSRSHVANTLRLLTLPPKVLDMIRDGRLSAGHARTLVTVDNPEELANSIVMQGLSVREAEALTKEKSGRTSAKKASNPGKDPDTLALEEEIGNALGMKVSIDMKDAHKGALKVSFKSLDELDELLKRLSHLS